MSRLQRAIQIARHRLGREGVKFALRHELRWRPMENPLGGFSIVLGVPWDLRHLLPVNLQFVDQTNLEGLRDLFVVFDRRQREGGEELMRAVRERFPDLPITFLFYEPRPGRIIERVNISTFYNSMNTITALQRCRTRYAILHDFDLYPLDPEYFRRVVDSMGSRELRFSGLELTHFDGLTDDDAIIGTWCLGIDVAWLRENWKPIHCFHRSARLDGREVNLDPYSWIQTKTPERALADGIDAGSCCHVRNLCSTFLRFVSGDPFKPVWRLHYLWYLEELSGEEGKIDAVTRAMDAANSSILTVDDRAINFADTRVTCANVLRDELERMEGALFGSVRGETTEFIDAFARFLAQFGDSERLDEAHSAMKTTV